MPHLLYIHGFLSSPLSYKAQAIKQWLLDSDQNEIHYHCPQLTPYPDECAQTLAAWVEEVQQQGDSIYLMGSSMGGFWATWLAETYDLPAVLINPAVDVLELMPKYLNQPLQNYHTSDTYQLNQQHMQQLARYIVPVTRNDNYWLLVQTADETLDYRLATDKYAEVKQTIEQGGDHSFQGFDRYHQQTINFFQRFYQI